MKFGTLQSVLRAPLETVFDTAAQIGFDGVELDWHSPEEARTGSLSPNRRSGIKAAANIAGIEICSVAAHFLNGGGIAQAGHEAAAMEVLREGIQLCENLGARVLLVPFFGDAEFGDADEPRLIANLKALALDAEAFGVSLGVETTRPGARMRHILEAVGSPKIGSYWDMANCWSVGYNGVSDLRQLAGHVVQVHAKEWSGPRQPRIPGQYPGLNQVAFGEGDVPVEDTLKTLHDIGYDGYIVLETGCFGSPEASAAAALDLLKNASPSKT
jgi:sugar phosphate isomerase/epimerase